MPPNAADSSVPSSAYPGDRLGLPESGPGSLASFGRRFAGLVVDWGIAVAIAYFAFQYNPFAVMGVFVLLTWLSIALLGGSIGHIALGMRPLVRQVLVLLVLPPLVTDEDSRGMHDIATSLVLRRYVRG
jgi:hypothetical protein